jgi:hypothetical protein
MLPESSMSLLPERDGNGEAPPLSLLNQDVRVVIWQREQGLAGQRRRCQPEAERGAER